MQHFFPVIEHSMWGLFLVLVTKSKFKVRSIGSIQNDVILRLRQISVKYPQILQKAPELFTHWCPFGAMIESDRKKTKLDIPIDTINA